MTDLEDPLALSEACRSQLIHRLGYSRGGSRTAERAFQAIRRLVDVENSSNYLLRDAVQAIGRISVSNDTAYDAAVGEIMRLVNHWSARNLVAFTLDVFGALLTNWHGSDQYIDALTSLLDAPRSDFESQQVDGINVGLAFDFMMDSSGNPVDNIVHLVDVHPTNHILNYSILVLGRLRQSREAIEAIYHLVMQYLPSGRYDNGMIVGNALLSISGLCSGSVGDIGYRYMREILERFLPTLSPGQRYGQRQEVLSRAERHFPSHAIDDLLAQEAPVDRSVEDDDETQGEVVDFDRLFSGSGLTVQFNQEVEGDPAEGSLYLIRQIHVVPGQDDSQLQIVGEYQGRVFRVLLGLRQMARQQGQEIFHVFAEDIGTDDYPAGTGTAHSPIDVFNSMIIQEAFRNGITPNFTDEQRRLLAEYGAVLVLRTLFDDVYLHRTMSETEAADILSRSPFEHMPELMDIVMYRREQNALRQIQLVREQFPNDMFVMVYGAGHEFVDDVRKLDHPFPLYTTFLDGDESLVGTLEESETESVMQQIGDRPVGHRETPLQALERAIQIADVCRDRLEFLEFGNHIPEWESVDFGVISEANAYIYLLRDDETGLQLRAIQEAVSRGIIIHDWVFEFIRSPEGQLAVLLGRDQGRGLELRGEGEERMDGVLLEIWLRRHSRSGAVRERITALFHDPTD